NHITSKGKYKHITEIERYKIEAYLKDKKKPKEIAVLIGKSTRTVQREIKRGKVMQMDSELRVSEKYKADYAQNAYKTAASRKGPPRKLDTCPELKEYLERQILEKGYSPDAAVGRMAVEGVSFGVTVRTKTLYNAIDAECFERLTNKNLPEKGKKKKREYRRTRRVALNNAKGTSIEKRPKEADDRSEYGHWEMDLVLSGRGAKAALLTMTERKSREEIIVKIWDKSQKSVSCPHALGGCKKALDELEREMGSKAFKSKFKSVTTDNGSEFLDFEALEKSVGRGRPVPRTKMYYAHPYSSWERGTNENHNRMIRRRIPKGSDIGRYSKERIKQAQDWMNDYPRKILGYKTPNEVAAESFA
ncbi:MAG: IS30 family transposase, partial [Clostridiales Family XIII bacterium]|nr:IS30 family transposase [Clostridiales Family XIII bacterium]